jgi:hypothetical protein
VRSHRERLVQWARNIGIETLRGPATLRMLLDPNVASHGIDMAIEQLAPGLSRRPFP